MSGATCMELAALLELKRDAILASWRERIISTYPEATSEFLGKQADRFGNPLGHAISEGTERVYDEICSEMDAERLLAALDGIIRIRSVQDFTATEAVSFIFDLKPAIRQAVEAELAGGGAPSELADLDSRIDRVALLAFEKYMACREKLHEIRNNEIKKRMAKLLQAADERSAASPEQPATAWDTRPVTGGAGI